MTQLPGEPPGASNQQSRDGAVFQVRYREGSIVKRCLLDQA